MMQYRFVKIFNHSILVQNLPGYICESIKSTLIFNKSENENIRFRKLKLKFANPAGNQKFFQKKNDKSIRNKEIGPIRIQRFFQLSVLEHCSVPFQNPIFLLETSIKMFCS